MSAQTYYPIPVLTLRKIFDMASEKSALDKLVRDLGERVPVCSNYLIENRYEREGWGFWTKQKMIGKVIQIYREHTMSFSKISEHIASEDLTPECQIGLSTEQYGELKGIINTLKYELEKF